MGYRIRFYAEGTGTELFYIGGHIAQGRVGTEMAERLGDHGHIAALIDHLVCHTVPQQVRAFPDAILADAAEVVGSIDNI